MSDARKTVVRVSIVGEEHAIRSDATPEHTRAVAAYVDEAIRRVLASGPIIEQQKAAILAALQITDELFQCRAAAREVERRAHALAADVRRWLPGEQEAPNAEGPG